MSHNFNVIVFPPSLNDSNLPSVTSWCSSCFILKVILSLCISLVLLPLFPLPYSIASCFTCLVSLTCVLLLSPHVYIGFGFQFSLFVWICFPCFCLWVSSCFPCLFSELVPTVCSLLPKWPELFCCFLLSWPIKCPFSETVCFKTVHRYTAMKRTSPRK